MTEQKYDGWERKLHNNQSLYFTRRLAKDEYVYVVGAHRPMRNGSAIKDIPEACYDRAVGDVLREVEQYALGLAHTQMLESIETWAQVNKEVGR
jgi:hypothetical protein